jgi:D-hexose-6-phosphate mutarotase
MPVQLVNSSDGKLEKVIVVEESTKAIAEIYLFGATLTSWKPDGRKEVIFVRYALLDDSINFSQPFPQARRRS